jgi:hypothetical protein
MMTAKNSYWDHERCSWVVHETAAPAMSDALAAAMPEQRDDELAAAPAQATAPPA